MSPDLEIVCECPCEGCLFHSVCWSYVEYLPFQEHAELCIDDNFCSRSLLGFPEPLDKYLSNLLTP